MGPNVGSANDDGHETHVMHVDTYIVKLINKLGLSNARKAIMMEIWTKVYLS